MDKDTLNQQAIAHLTYLGSLTDQIKAMHEAQAAAVDLCRVHNASWRMISVALGVSTQAAWERFSGHERDSEVDQDSLPIAMPEKR